MTFDCETFVFYGADKCISTNEHTAVSPVRPLSTLPCAVCAERCPSLHLCRHVQNVMKKQYQESQQDSKQKFAK